MHCELRSFDLSTVTFAYAKVSDLSGGGAHRKEPALSACILCQSTQGMTASITWRDQVMPQWGQYTLEFFSDVDGAIGESSGNEESQENPQSVMAHAFERILNSGKDSGPSFWANFIKVSGQKRSG